MNTLDELLGLDPASPEALRADLLAENDQALLDALVQVRIDRGLTQAQVAAIMGVKQPSIADFEAHDSNPTLSRIRRYAHAVGALIAHKVEVDSGQLLDNRRDQWVATTVTVQAAPKPSRHEALEVTRIVGARKGSFRPQDVADDRSQLTLAA